MDNAFLVLTLGALALLAGLVALAVAVGSLPLALAVLLRWVWRGGVDLVTVPSDPNARHEWRVLAQAGAVSRK